MTAKKSTYTNEDISQLKGADRVRKRPSVIFGSDSIDGCQHSVFEILSNSIDEAREGYGNKIIVTRYLDKSVEIQDFGRGIPMDYNEKENAYNWHLVFCEMYAGGKYNTNKLDANYSFSLGLNGLGLCATQYTSEYMDAEVFRDGFKYTMHFEKGEPVGDLVKEPYTKKNTGSRIKWKPDLKVFTDIDIPLEYYQDILKRQSIVNAGMTFILKDQVGANTFDTYEYFYERGMVDYIEEITNKETFTDIQVWETERIGRDREDKDDYKLKIVCAVAFSNKHTLKDYYHNSSPLEYGGAPEKATRSAFVYQIDAYLKANNMYRKSDSKITMQDIEDCLILIISSFSTETSYENQTKKAISNKFIQDAMTDFLKHQLEIYFIENKADADKIAEQVLINMRSRVHAEQARVNIKKTLTQKVDMSNRVQKFVDCRTKDISRRELFIVEGDSALGSCKQARDSEFQAVIPVRGKILNCMKSNYNAIFKSEIITDLIKVLGCGVEITTKTKDINQFSLDNLNWDKVIICTDADVDGYQIRTLILAMIYRLMPKLITAGKIFIAESPLYEIHSGDEVWFAYTELEKTKVLEEIGNKKYTIQRSKGLGENDADMMWLTTMNPDTRRLINVEESDVEETLNTFEVLLGNDLEGRKEKIAEEGHLYLEMLDLS